MTSSTNDQSIASHELSGSHECPVPLSFCVFESPVSEGQVVSEDAAAVLRSLAAQNACTEVNTARKRLWKLLRDLKAIEEGTGRELDVGDILMVFNEWYRQSQPFLDPSKTYDDYLTEFLAGFSKVRMPTGKGDTINKAVAAVAQLSVSELPIIPGLPNASEPMRRLAGLHREISRLTGGNTYFLGCRDAAKACPGLTHQKANQINRALTRLGVVKIVRVGDERPNGKATEFRYLLPQTDGKEM